jgi:hypothetical protein
MRTRLGGLLLGVAILVCALSQAGVQTRLPAPARAVFPRRVPLLGVLGEFGCRGLVAHVERRPHGRWADRRRCASSDSTSADSNTGSTE